MRAYMYPGQGSQARGMARELFARYPELVSTSDEILGFSVARVCRDDPLLQLSQTQFTQPILYVVNALSHLQQLDLEDGRAPDFVLGHSLGEFNALLAAGCFDFEEGLRLVKCRGELFAEARQGAMAAVIDMPVDGLRSFLAEHGYYEIDIAAINTPSQAVVSGAVETIKVVVDRLTQIGKRSVPLNTSGAFHSRLMARAAERFREELSRIKLLPPKIPVISNVTARPHGAGTIAENLVAQIVSPVRWCQSVQTLLAAGVESFVEVGHGRTLTNMLQQIRNETGTQVLAELADALAPRAIAKPAIAQTVRVVAPAEMVRDWNVSRKVGCDVTTRMLPGAILRTRSDAQLLFGCRAVVYLEHYEGYFDLRDVITEKQSVDGP